MLSGYMIVNSYCLSGGLLFDVSSIGHALMVEYGAVCDIDLLS